jgi:hypothetical protein
MGKALRPPLSHGTRVDMEPVRPPNLRTRWLHTCFRNRGTMMEAHLSVATIAALSKILRTCRNLRHVMAREPTAAEIAVRLRIPPETIRKLLGRPPQPAPFSNRFPESTDTATPNDDPASNLAAEVAAS